MGQSLVKRKHSRQINSILRVIFVQHFSDEARAFLQSGNKCQHCVCVAAAAGCHAIPVVTACLQVRHLPSLGLQGLNRFE